MPRAGSSWLRHGSGSEGRGRLSFTLVVLLPLIGLALGIWSVVAVLDMPLEGWDTRADWLTAKAALAGSSPYLTLEEIGLEYGVEVGDFEGTDPAPHPRSPGALVLQTPLVLMDVGLAVTLTQGASLVLVCFLVCSLLLRVEGGLILRLALGATILLSVPLLAGIFYAAQSALVAVLLFGSVFCMNRGRDSYAGVMLGIATTLKLFPALALVVLIRQRRWRTIVPMAATVLVLNIGGMIVFGLSFEETMQALRAAALAWVDGTGNLSLAGIAVALGLPAGIAITGAPIAGLVLALVVSVRSRNAVPLVLLAAPLFSPLAWGHYQLAAIGLLAETQLPGRVLSRVVAAWVVSWGLYTAVATLTVGPVPFGQGLLFAISVGLPVIVFLAERTASPPRQWEPVLAAG